MTIIKIDSNVTGLSYAEEASLKTLPGSPVWYPLEPNGFDDFGGETKLIARNPINPSRQRKKGVITDLDAKGGFGQDFTQNNSLRLMQGFFFADLREKATTNHMNSTQVAVSAVDTSTKTYTIGSGGASFKANDLVLGSGFSLAANNGLKTVASSTGTTIVVNETTATEASPPAASQVQVVGAVLASGVATIDVSGTLPRLVRASGAKSFLDFGLIAGEWIFIGGDSAGTKFANAANNGFCRVASVAATYIEFDKTSGTMVTDAGTGKTVQLFFGNVLKNESGPSLIVRRTYQLERTLGQDGSGTMSEYLTGAVANELQLHVKQADKLNINAHFVACEHEARDGATGVKSGSRPTLTAKDAFNTSQDFARIKMATVSSSNPNPSPLFAYVTDLQVDIKNGVTPLKAVGNLGAFDLSAGTFEVNGQLTAYFAGVDAVSAITNNSDVTIDMAIVKNNAGYVLDIPLLALGDGRLKVEQDKPITIPLKTEAAECAAGYTLLLNEFPYLPDAA